MTMPIEVTCGPGSSLDGVMFEFDATVVSLGRHPSNNIAFSAENDRVVSGHHVELRVESDVLWLHDLGSSNGTYINGVRIEGRVALCVGDRVLLGKDGAEIQVKAPGLLPKPVAIPAEKTLREPPPTETRSKGPGRDTIMRMVSKAYESERRRARPLLILLIAIVLILTLAIVAGVVWFMGGGVEKGAREAARKEARDEAETTARGVAEQTSRRIRRAADARLEELSENFKKRLRESNRDFSQVFPKIEKSVYPVFRQRTVGETTRTFSGGGTCWVVAPGILATNAHVAEGHLKDGTKLLIRAGNPVRDIEVQRVKIHPGYKLWAKLRREYLPLDPHGSGFLQFIPACDVALMWCRPEDSEHFGAPLEMASDETLKSLARGTPAAFLGFPVEGGIVGALERSEATSDIGPISQVFDFFLEQNSPSLEQLVTYNFKGEGGASGSPVFGLDSRVVAIHSAGNFKSVAGQRISQGSTAFGQRVDLVKQLLGGEEIDELFALEKNWRERFLGLWTKNHDTQATIRALKRLPFWPATILSARKLHSGKLGPGKSIKVRYSTGTRWVLVALVTGDRIGKIGLRGSANSLPNSWHVGVYRRKKGQHEVEVYQPKAGSDTVEIELWLFDSK